jgi:hypothetical protein
MPYKHKLSSRMLEEGLHEQLPEPYDRMFGARIHSPRWGNGWLGLDRRGDEVVIWHVSEDLTCQPLNFDTIHLMVDPKTGNIWMIFKKADGQAHPFLIFPDEAIGIGYIPDVVRQLVDGEEHER